MKRFVLPLCLLLAALASGCGGAKTDTSLKPRAIPVRTASVERRDLQDVVVLTGTLRPRSQVQVVAEVAARVLRILRDEGARVEAGETLAVLDETDYRLSQDRARASLAVAEANQAHALAERDRADNLLKTGGITDKDRLSAEVNLKVAEASLSQARAESAITAQQLSRTQVKAPFGGRIAKRFVDVGAMLPSGAPLFTLVDDSHLEFRAPVPSADWPKLRVGATADVTVDAVPGLHSAGKLARIAPLVDERTRSFEAVVDIPGRPELVGGLFARATLDVGALKEAVVVPPGALLRDGSDPAKADAFVVVSGQAQRRSLKLGTELADAIQVTEGLALGDVVVLNPSAALSTGSPVEAQAAGK